MNTFFRFARPVVILVLFSPAGERPQQAIGEVPSAARGHSMGIKLKLEGVPDFGQVTPTLYRGGQPTYEGFERLAKIGINIVVDTGRSTPDEKLVKELGMRYVFLPWYCPFPKDKVFAQFIKLVQENPDKKIFVHCRLGEDRTGMMIAAYRMGAQGWTAEEARKEMHKFGYKGVHHLMCPGLARYEKSFPRRLKENPVFQGLGGEEERK